MASMVYQGNLLADLTTIRAQDVSAQLANHSGGRSMLYLQWCLRQSGYYTDPVDGTYRASVQTALDGLRQGNYDDPQHLNAPLTGPTINQHCLAAIVADYLDTPTAAKTVSA